MPPEVPVNIHERRKYLPKMRPLYGRARRRQKSAPLTEMETVTGLRRKSLLRLLHGDLRRKPRQRQGGPAYTAATAPGARHALEQAPGAPPGHAEDVRQTLGLWQTEPWGGMPFPPSPTPGKALHATAKPS